MTRNRKWSKRSWWWDDSVLNVIEELNHERETQKKGEIIKEEYLKGKQKAKHAVYKSKKSAKDQKLADIKQSNIFKMAKQMMKDSKPVLKKK